MNREDLEHIIVRATLNCRARFDVLQVCYSCTTVNVMRSINMPTTTIRLEDELRARIAAAAARSGRSSHAFILDALSDMVERSELDEELHRIADKRWAALQRTGESVAWEDAAAYLKARAAGQKPRRPTARRPTP
ncbi:ribbon-helix-helix protein, CopG family [Variovorax sp. OV700]|jgi:predicted transcriptional regulator|uniref:ribbon-helix-helix protein, CopG family n=1 Tax=Variovorax sp. OV700 TaxID=1882826 RepID=UPI00088223A4|nr:ribbon-helix-helix protein, CopG family [Variovorax sp. OV700]SDH81392.1 Predicted transcriptional regulator [Variovorax sp. OV700]